MSTLIAAIVAKPGRGLRSVGVPNFPDTPITSRSPKLYLKLDETSGTPADSASGGYGGTISVSGTPAGYHQLTNQGFGIRLGTTAYIQATHHTVFTTSGGDGPFGSAGIYLDHGIVESEVTFSIHVAFPTALQNNWVIFSKAPSSASSLDPGVSLRVHADGSVELRVREYKYRSDVRMFAPAGTVAQGGDHHFTVSLGYQGAWFTVDGRQAELGFKNGLAWWGLDHRTNGVEGTSGTADNVRVTNTSNIVLGRTLDQSTSADITVSKFAVFYSGATRITRGQVTTGFTLADCQALAGASGSVLADPAFPAAGNQTPTAGTNTIQAAINAANAAGGGTVFLSGTYTQSVDLNLLSNVRISTNSSAIVNFTNDAKFTNALPSVFVTLPNVALSQDGSTYTATIPASVSSDAILVLVDTTALQSLYLGSGGTIADPAVRLSETIPVRTKNGTTSLSLTRGSMFTFNTGTRLASTAYNPPVTDAAIDGNIIFRKSGGTNTNPVFEFQGIRRFRLNNITVERLDPTNIMDLMTFQIFGGADIRINGCTIRSESNDTSPTGALHPYVLQLHAVSNHDTFNCTGFSEGWAAYDVEGDNMDDHWGFGSLINATGGVQWGGHVGDCRNSTWASNDFTFTSGCHTCYRMSFIDNLLTSGGGMTIDGYGHHIQAITASSGGANTQMVFPRGAGMIIWAHCQFNNNVGQWGGGNVGLAQSIFVNLHYLTPIDTNSFSRVPIGTGNTFIDVDTANFSNGTTFPPA